MTYTVCNSNNFVNVEVTSALIGSAIVRNYTNVNCYVRETTQVLRFTASQAVDTPYTIWYSYTFQQTINHNADDASVNIRDFTMPAGQTVHDLTVMISKISTCS